MSWQKCPICDGKGYINAYSAEDCWVCKGKCIIDEITGLPPGTEVKRPKRPNSMDTIDSDFIVIGKRKFSSDAIAMATIAIIATSLAFLFISYRVAIVFLGVAAIFSFAVFLDSVKKEQRDKSAD